MLANGTQTAVRYRDEILRPIVRPYAAVGPGFLLVQDNARPHVVRVCKAVPGWRRHWCHWLALTFPRPESNWETLGRYVSVHPPPCQVAPQTVQELPDALIQVWEEITPGHHPSSHQEHAQTVVSVIQTRGGHTHYWATLWVVVMKFMQVGSACDYNFFTGFHPDLSYVIFFSTNYTTMNVYQWRFSTWIIS